MDPEPAAQDTSTSLVNVARFLPGMASREGSRTAVRVAVGRQPGGQIHYLERSFREVDNLSDAAAHLLREQGVEKGTKVLLLVRPGLELIVLCFSLFKTGAVPVVIDPGMGLKSFLSCVRRTRPEVLLAIPKGLLISRLARGSFQSLRERIAVRGGGAFLRELESYRKRGAFPIAKTASEDLAAILFTSGSTGPAKGVCYEHGMFEAQVRLIRKQYGITPGEVDLPMLPIFALFNPALGMTTVIPEMNPSRPARVDPRKIVQAIEQNGVTNSFGSPVLWRKIGNFCREQRIRLPTLRRILMAGAPVPPETIRLFDSILAEGAEIHTPYGATEALPVSSLSGAEILGTTWQETEKGAGTCVGRAFPEMEIAILETTEAELPASALEARLPPRAIGEICVNGPVVTQEYHEREEATKMAKIPDAGGARKWHRMGDLGYLDEKGMLWFCGRKAERVELAGGSFLYTDCCEAIFNCHPKVFRTALTGPVLNGEVRAILWVEPEPGAFPRVRKEREAFRAELLELGSAHAHTRGISEFCFRRHFPVDVRHNAKIHRLRLKRILEKG